jgi:hypothetical protein
MKSGSMRSGFFLPSPDTVPEAFPAACSDTYIRITPLHHRGGTLCSMNALAFCSHVLPENLAC